MKRIFFLVTTIFLISLTYAILRYNVFGDVPWSMLPLYIMNKSFAVTSMVMLMIIYLLPILNRDGAKWRYIWEQRSLFGRLTFVFILMHTVVSLMIFRPSVFPKFFNTIDQVNLEGNVSMLAGVLSLVTVWYINRLYRADSDHPGEIRQFSRRILALLIFFLVIHLSFMGIRGWLDINSWPGSMPPISLLSVIIMIVFLLFYYARKAYLNH